MPITRKPLLRAEILDELLNNDKLTGKELLNKLNMRLKNSDQSPINERTFKRDLDFLEIDKMAPLHRPEKGDMSYYYVHNFSLKDIPLDGEELNMLKQAIDILRKVESFQMINDLDLIIGKLENRVHINVDKNQSVVQFEDHTRAKGIQWFSELFDATKEKTSLEIKYLSFRHSEAKDFIVHPYLLKEYRNRWWLLGRHGSSNKILTLGLDRIISIKTCKNEFLDNELFDPDTYFQHVIGVSVDYDSKPEDILLKVYPVSVQQVETKPIHKNQDIIDRKEDGSMIVKLHLIVNYERRATILGFGAGVEVIEPSYLRTAIRDCCTSMSKFYE